MKTKRGDHSQNNRVIRRMSSWGREACEQGKFKEGEEVRTAVSALDPTQNK